MIHEKRATAMVSQHDALHRVPVSFEVTNKFPSDVQMPVDAELRLHEDGDKATFILARDPASGELLGFSILVPGSFDEEVEMRFRYVYPQHRRKDIGTNLRLEGFRAARELGYRVMSSGINDVMKVDATGAARQNFGAAEGGWQSYGSMLKVRYEDGTYPVTTIKSAGFDMGSASLAFSTLLTDDKGRIAAMAQPTLPVTPEKLLEQIFVQHVPKEMTREQALTRMTNGLYGVITFESGLVNGAPFAKPKVRRWNPFSK